MYSLVLKISHSVRAKDFIAVARGVYRVIDGGKGSAQIRRSSWMDDHGYQLKSQQQSGVANEEVTVDRIQKEQSTQEGQKIIINKIQQTISQSEPEQPKLSIKQAEANHQPTGDTAIPPSMSKKQRQYLSHSPKSSTAIPSDYNPETSSIPGSRISRIFQFGKLGLNLASASFLTGNNKNEQYYEGMANKISEQLCKMRGAPLKLAQMLSIQEDNLIPAPIRKAFERARESAHVIPPDQVEFMMRSNLGENWKGKFKHFQDKPFASASIGQVHRASLHDGKEVAVKVQYRSVKSSINSDINNLKLLLKLPKIFPKTMYMDRILQKTQQELMQECNYTKQKELQLLYAKILHEVMSEEDANLYKIPDVYEECSTGEVLTSEYLEGIKMKDLEEGKGEGYPQSLKNEIGRRIMLLTFKELFEMGIMQSDPNPSNFTYNWQKDQLNLFDFGATHIYRPEFLREYYRIIEGAVNEDYDQIWDASIKTGFVTGEENKAMKNSHIQSVMITGEPLRWKGEYDFGAQEITKRVYKTIPEMLKNRLKPPPEEVYSLHRKLSGSYLACIRLGAKVDCSEIWKSLSFRTVASDQ